MINNIKRLIRLAKQGDMKALNKALQLNNQLAKKANRKLLALERAKRTDYMYPRIEEFTNNYLERKPWRKPRFTTSKKKLSDIDTLEQQLREMNTFIKSESSTARGQKKLEKKMISSIEEKLGRKIDKKEEFLSFLKSGYMDSAKKFLPSDTVADIVSESLDKGLSAKDIEKEFDDYMSGLYSFNEFLENLGVEFKL